MAVTRYRTHYAAALAAIDEGTTVRVAGWVSRRRDHGGIVFLDVRDTSGTIQAVIDPEALPNAHALKMEWVVSMSGMVRPRPEGTENPDMVTGGVEIAVDALEILSPAETLPFMINDRVDVDERVRLEYRYLDLRRPRMAANLRARSAAVTGMREVLSGRGFLEVETPTLIRSTPEGARDMLVPSRLRKGSFYALPQSPQLFKQLLMVGGVDRYYQIARCYRDEDFRSDRQLEFTQLDVEGAFWGRDDVFETFEGVVLEVVRRLRGVDPDVPFRRMTWADAMDTYGTDKPDVRFGMKIVTVDQVFEGTGFAVFARTLGSGGSVRAIDAGPRKLSRSELDGLVERARGLGAKGLVWAYVEDEGLRSPIAKFLTDEEMTNLVVAMQAKTGDLLLLAADTWRTSSEVLGQLRLDLGRPQGHEDLAFLWVTDFPMFDAGEGGGLVPSHHPFTAPVSLDDMRERPDKAISQAYDLVLNGSELGSGSVRIHDPRVQREIFEILGIGDEEAERRFGWFVKALRYGTPPHAGFALGVDRLLAILQQETSIRDVIPFPKTQTGVDPMTGSPTLVDDDQLKELGICIRPEVRAELED